ncbi:MAG: hypothetical protein QOJ99_3106 [Bryobacterales bacterium]|jgi:predicted PurR-regulated permease PerM|nr:hypothetical protein [Bryobacterales bacterium]
MTNQDPLVSRRRIQEVGLLIAICVAFWLCWQLARPFLAAITWALALAVVGHPLHRRLEHWLRPNFAALLSVLAITIILLAPGALLLQKALDDAGGGFATIAESLNPAHLREVVGRYAYAASVLEWVESRYDLGQVVKQAASELASQTPAALSGSIRLVTQFALMLVVLFFFFRDRVLLLQALAQLMPLSASETRDLFGRISKTIYATLYGNLLVKFIQGALGGLMFWILGLPSPVPFGAAMALLAVLPIVGTSLIWAPAAVWLLVHGSWIKALILAAWGGFVISIVDNFLYLILVAGEIRIHTLGVLFSVFGGLIALGLSGIVLGPVILATTLALLEVWRLRTAPEKESLAP